MNFGINIRGEWIQLRTPYVNVEDVWYPCIAMYVNVHEQWMQVWRHEAQILTLPVGLRNNYRGLQDVRSCAA